MAPTICMNYASKLLLCFCICTLMEGSSHFPSCLISGSREVLSWALASLLVLALSPSMGVGVLHIS